MSDEQNRMEVWKVYYSDGSWQFVQGKPVDKPHCHIIRKTPYLRNDHGEDGYVASKSADLAMVGEMGELNDTIAILTAGRDAFKDTALAMTEKLEVAIARIRTLTAKHRKLIEAVEALTKADPYACDPTGKYRICAFCGNREGFSHESDCVFTLAAAQLKEQQDD